MKLSVIERILLGDMLSGKEGNFTTLKLVRRAREALSFNDEEIKLLEFVQEGNNLRWNMEAAMNVGEIEIPISDTVTDLITLALTRLNDEAKLTEQHFSLYEKFIMDDDLH